MTQQEKIELIKANSELIITSLNAYLDTAYLMTDKYFDENGNLKEGLEEDAKVEEFIKSTRQDCCYYESVRTKLVNGDFNLSLAEIARAGLGLVFASARLHKEIKTMKSFKDEIDEILKQLMDEETWSVDFSQTE